MRRGPRLRIFSAIPCVFTLAILLTAVPSHATVILLSDQNSSIQINDSSSAGQTNWFVDGTNNLTQQWFWVSVNGATPVAVNTLSAPIVSNQTANSVTLSYSNPTLAKVDLTFTLLGQVPGTAAASLSVAAGVTNNTGAQATVSLFQFANFDLNSSAAGDTVAFPSATQITQAKGATIVSEDTVIIPFQGHEGNTPGTVLGAVTTNALTNLPAIGGSVGPGDESWAVRWDRTLVTGGAFSVSKGENIQGVLPAPEPSSLVLCGIGFTIGGVFAARRRS